MAERESAVADFCGAVGARVAHVTAADNLSFIMKLGLCSAHDVALSLGYSATSIALRDERTVLEGNDRRAVLNHQKPIRHGLAAAKRVLDGHTVQSWAEQLDRRVFLWPEREFERFAKSIARDRDIAVIWLRSDALAEAHFNAIDLAPINTGNFTQGGAHARRGDWIYVPLSEGLAAFRKNRQLRMGAKRPDKVKEISLREAIRQTCLQK